MRKAKDKRNSESVKDRMRSFREDEVKLTQKQFAEKVGYSHMMISSIEVGKSNPSAEMLIKIAEVYPNFDIHYILMGKKSEYFSSADGKKIHKHFINKKTLIYSALENLAKNYFPLEVERIKKDKRNDFNYLVEKCYEIKDKLDQEEWNKFINEAWDFLPRNIRELIDKEKGVGDLFDVFSKHP